jgi:hypothetical protein
MKDYNPVPDDRGASRYISNNRLEDSLDSPMQRRIQRNIAKAPNNTQDLDSSFDFKEETKEH